MSNSDLYQPGKRLRSADWFEPLSLWGIIHRGWVSASGFSHANFKSGKPVIGICNTFSELNNCNMNLRDIAEAVKRGVWQAGGFPLEFPVISLGEVLMKPTTMLFRNLMSMDVEECIAANPLDAVVLLGGCDKTVPAMIMGAISADIPSLVVTSGPTLRGSYRGRDLGSGHDITGYLNEYQAGMISRQDLDCIECSISRSSGHCGVMGTASTMACFTEAMGLTLPGGASIPGPDSRRLHLAEETGRQAVRMALDNVRLTQIVTPKSIENAIRVLHAIGGSTNAIVHLICYARRLGYELPLDYFDHIGREVPLVARVKPSGPFGMEEFHAAGGIQAVLREIKDMLHRDCLTVDSRTIGQWIDAAEPSWNPEVITPIAKTDPASKGSLRVLRGSLCPDGALIKISAASPKLLKHKGPAYVFEDYQQLLRDLSDENLPVTADHVLILKGAGPIGAPGMPEWGVFGVPLKLFKQGVRDIVRISDARASGTSSGTIVVHAAPEGAVGGPIGLVETGDLIELDVASGRLDLLVDEKTLSQRRARHVRPAAPERGYKRLYHDRVLQADKGCDFDFLAPPRLQSFPTSS